MVDIFFLASVRKHSKVVFTWNVTAYERRKNVLFVIQVFSSYGSHVHLADFH